MALRGRRINNFIRLWCLVASGGLHICVLSISFQKNDMGWPQQPLQEEYQISVKNWIFDDPFHKKGLVLVIWVLGMIKSSGSVIFLMKWGCWGHWGHWGCWGRWGHWGWRSFKAWKITTENFRVIQVIELSFISMFLGKKSLVESWSIKLDLSSFSIWRCWGHWGCRGSKAWKITTEGFRVIHVIKFRFIWMFWKEKVLGKITKYHVEF